MDVAEFDQFAEEYHKLHSTNIAITGESPEYFAEYKIKLLRKFAANREVSAARVLDFGSGTGNSIPYFKKYFADAAFTGTDVSQKSLDLSRARFPEYTDLRLIENNRIPADDRSVDIAFSACVFHHIPHQEHLVWLRELRRVVRPGGMLVIFEHNPLNPLTVRAVNTCPFDANARLIRSGVFAERCKQAGWQFAQGRYHLFFPRALSALRPLEKWLVRMPIGAQYSMVCT